MKKTGSITTFLLILLVLPWSAAFCEKIVQVSAAVDAEEIGTGDTLTLRVTVETENVTRLPKPEIPEMKYFSVINESSTSQTSISIINGKTTRSKTTTFTYILQPEKKGSFTIPPVTVKYGGRIYKTDPITITVVEGRVKKSLSPRSLNDERVVDEQSLKKDIFIRIEPDRAKVFKGEQIFLTYILYSRLDIDSVSLRQNPSFPGFYIEDVFNATRLEYKKETYNDRIFTTSVIKKVALFPLQPGTYTPKPLVLEVTVILKDNNVFDIFGYPYTFNIASRDIQIQARPLPPSRDRTKFNGIVGDLSVDLIVPTSAVTTGESVTCYLNLQSSGNMSAVTDPGLHLSLKGRIYLSHTQNRMVEKKGRAYFIKKFEYTIIPEENGKLTISSPDFLYFDLESKNYVLASAQPVQITVSGENIVREKPLREHGKKLSRGSLHFIKKDVKSLKNRHFAPLRSPLFYMYHCTLIAAVAVLFLLKMSREKLKKNEWILRKRRARAHAIGLLNKARQDEQKPDYDYTKTVDDIHRALVTYIADKTGASTQEITNKNIGGILSSLEQLSDSTKKDIETVLQVCTAFKFSSGSVHPEAVQNLREKTAGIIDEMERALGRR